MDVEEMSDESIRKKTSEHLLKIGKLLSSSCAAASRFYMLNLERHLLEDPASLKIGLKRGHLYCNHCGTLWSHGNHRIRVHPPPSLNGHLKKLLKLEAEQPWRLNNHQKRKIRKFCESSNKIVYSCFVCNKKTVFPGTKTPKCKRFQDYSSSTPLSKVKIKKGDLNAGLFISSPSCSKNEYQMDISENNTPEICEKTPIGKKILSLNDSGMSAVSETPRTFSDNSLNKVNLFKCNTTPVNIRTSTPKSKVSSAGKQSSSRKKKKTLLDQILKQEQGGKKKTSLSSFLVSL